MLARLTPMDDVLMLALTTPGKRGRQWVQNILRTVLGWPDLIVEDFYQQATFERLGGARGVAFDVYAVDSEGRKYDLEIQIDSRGASPLRARYNTSVMDIENLDPNDDFDLLPETYTIFICKSDPYKMGEPKYEFEMYSPELGLPMGDKRHTIFVNTRYRDDTDFGKLMSDMNTADPEKMQLSWMRESTHYYKDTKEGVKQLDATFNAYMKTKEAERIAILLDRGVSVEMVHAAFPEFTIEEIEAIRSKLQPVAS